MKKILLLFVLVLLFSSCERPTEITDIQIPDCNHILVGTEYEGGERNLLIRDFTLAYSEGELEYIYDLTHYYYPVQGGYNKVSRADSSNSEYVLESDFPYFIVLPETLYNHILNKEFSKNLLGNLQYSAEDLKISLDRNFTENDQFNISFFTGELEGYSFDIYDTCDNIVAEKYE